MNGAEFLRWKGITQAQLARVLNCRRNNVNIWFSGAHAPRVETLARLTGALNELGAGTEYDEVYRVLAQSRKDYAERKRG